MLDPEELERARGMVSSPVYVIILLLFGALVDSILRGHSRPARPSCAKTDRGGGEDKEPDGRH